MAHNIDMTNGRANIAFLGSRKDVWHRLGQEMQTGMTVEQWADAAGLAWSAEKAPAFVSFKGEMTEVPDVRHIVRNDNGHVLGTVSDRYQPVQPADVLAWFADYIHADDRFQLDVAGSLKQGEIIWATARYNGDIKVGGDSHDARVLMTTTFDGSGSTVNQMTMTRVVCNNTLNVALADNKAVVRTRHSTRFNADKVGRELAALAQSVEAYKVMGDRMAETHMSKDTVSRYFKALLDIPFDAPQRDVSTRKLNQFADLNRAYRSTVTEGTEPETAWTALNAVTRYVDHDRSTRGGSDQGEARFLSAQFGSGAQMKAKAVELLTADEEFKALLSRPFVPATSTADLDVAALLARPFRS
jgi:phage/plasmid-like protein (TIGR03299 family)